MENKVSLPIPPVPLAAWYSLPKKHRLDFNLLKPLEDLGTHEGDCTRVLGAIEANSYKFKDHPIYHEGQEVLMGYKLPSYLLTRDRCKRPEGPSINLLHNCTGDAPWIVPELVEMGYDIYGLKTCGWTPSDFIVVQWMATNRGRDLLQDAMCNAAYAAGVPRDARFGRLFTWKDLNEGDGWPRTVARLDFTGRIEGSVQYDTPYSAQLRFHDERGGMLFRNSECFESLNLLPEDGMDTLFTAEVVKTYPST